MIIGNGEHPNAERPVGERPSVGLRLRLLHGFSLSLDGKPVPVPLNEQRLLAFLAVNDQLLLRSYVAGALWLDSSEKHALGNLRSSIWRLNQFGVDIVQASRTHVRLSPSVSVDVRDMARLAATLIQRPSGFETNEIDETPLRGELLPGWYDEWVVIERERTRQLQLHGLEALCARLLAFGQTLRAVQVGLAAVAAEPLRESAHRLLIQAHLAEGNVAEAIRQYDLYRTLLLKELGIEPSPTIKRLVHAEGLLSTA
jgi:DNA-binding SARP family transcriptional activator